MDHTWFIAYDSDSDINPVGMCAAVGKGAYYQLCHDFVIPIYRGKGVYQMLFDKRFSWLSGFPSKAVCTKMSVGMYLKHGFKQTRQTVNYTFVERF
jgi:hypothetical protein